MHGLSARPPARRISRRSCALAVLNMRTSCECPVGSVSRRGCLVTGMWCSCERPRSRTQVRGTGAAVVVIAAAGASGLRPCIRNAPWPVPRGRRSSAAASATGLSASRRFAEAAPNRVETGRHCRRERGSVRCARTGSSREARSGRCSVRPLGRDRGIVAVGAATKSSMRIRGTREGPSAIRTISAPTFMASHAATAEEAERVRISSCHSPLDQALVLDQESTTPRGSLTT